MARGLTRKARAAGRDEREGGAASLPELDIEIDERRGRLRIYDPRAFRDGRRAFCRRLLEAVLEHPDLARAEVDLAASSCRLEFDRGAVTAGSMAEIVTEAIRRAAADRDAGDRRHWWSRPARWTGLTAYRTPVGVSWWETLESAPGRIRLRHEDLPGDRDRLADMAEALATLDGVEGSRASAWSRTLALEYRPGSPVAHRLLDAAERARREIEPAGGSPRTIALPGREAVDIEVATGARRLGYLALAGGSFAMTVIGLVVPGIPTVPFLLTTGYYLARSSPRLNQQLRRMPVFGPVLVEWERHHGLSRASKARLIGLTAAIIVVTAVLAAGAPVTLVVILVIATISVYGIARLPGLPDEAAEAPSPGRPLRLALPSP